MKLEDTCSNKISDLRHLQSYELVMVSSFKHLALRENIQIILGARSKSEWVVVAIENAINIYAVKHDVAFIND